MVRLLASLIIGAGVGAGALILLTGDTRFGWVALTALVLGPILLTLIVVTRSLGTLAAPDPEAVSAARDAGRLAGGRILDLSRTGTTINDVPEYSLDIFVESGDRAPYRTTVRELIDPALMPARLPGTLVSTVRLGGDTPDIALINDTPPSLRTRPGDEESFPRWDPTPGARVPGRPHSLISTGPHHRGIRLISYVCLASLGAALVLVPAHDEVALHVRSWTTGQDLASYMEGPGRAAQGVETFTRETGGTTVTEVLIYEDRMLITAPTSPGAATYDSYEVVANRLKRTGPATIQPEPAEEFETGSVDWSLVPDVSTRAITDSAIPAGQLGDHTQLVRVARDGGTEPGDVFITTSVSGDYGSFFEKSDLTGTIVSTS